MDAIYFDLDATLTDPKPGITRSIQHASKSSTIIPSRPRTN
jgi:phosphoglycolate phosphatase-like HAD superfamily hydrolase